jgi:23S rRNA (adenine2503-C2)-methyltransferase
MSDTLVQSVPSMPRDLTNAQERPVSLLGMSRQMLADWLVSQGEKPYRAQQLMQWVHQRGVLDYAQMTDLSKALREKLTGLAPIALPQIKVDQQASDGTRKWLLEVDGHNGIEMVFIPDKGRGTLCISSQVGCALTCTFCMTAKQGFNRNLSSDEIIGQVWLAQHLLRQDGWGESPVTNVVFMGMGEPLLNVNQVFPAAEILMDDWAYGLSKRRVTISTSGVVPAMDMLTERLDVSLAVSLHAANDALRDELVPINQKYPLAELIAACKRFLAKHPRRHIMFEYVMLEGINDTVKHAKEIITLLQGMSVKVNLIPFNPFPGSNYKTTEWDAAVEFQNRLIRSGVHTNIRRTRGEDIDAACGQLAGQVADRTKRQFRQHSVRFAPRAAGRTHAGGHL